MDRLIRISCIILSGLFVTYDCCAEAASRKLKMNDPMPEFKVVDSQGAEFSYSQTNPSALLVLFFSPEKQQSREAVEDIQEIIRSFPDFSHPLTFLAVSDDPNSTSPIKVNKDKLTVHFIKDTDYKLWGTFGVIASPTVFLAGTDGKIELIKAGYGYDFAPVVKAKLEVIMGLASEKDIQDVAEVKTVTNDSSKEKANRHLKMAQMLENSGNYDTALTQLKTAIQFDPNSTESAIELGRLYCVISDPNEAINMVKGLKPSGKVNQAKRAFVLGTAYGQLKDYSAAEKHLLEAVKLDPQSSQMYYELGKIYQIQGRLKEALNAYRKSLDLVYGVKQ